MSGLLELRDKVQRILAEAVGPIELTSDGRITFRVESARVFVRTEEQDLGQGRSRLLISISAPVLIGVPASPAVFEYVATSGWLFGHLEAVYNPENSSEVTIGMRHTLLGDFLDAEELRTAVFAVVITANQIDEELQAKFGGSRFHED